jgi:hypothetical protein
VVTVMTELPGFGCSTRMTQTAVLGAQELLVTEIPPDHEVLGTMLSAGNHQAVAHPSQRGPGGGDAGVTLPGP